jgi:DNA polymerase delta subunit 4
MPPKRRASGPATKSQQSTLAFHGGANKVTKAGARAQDAKKDLQSKSATKAIKPEVIDLEPAEQTKPTTVEADIIDQVEKEVAAQETERNPDDEAARRITDAAIKKYWTAKEKQRTAPRVHQDDLGLNEKVLREFDMSSHYGVSLEWYSEAVDRADIRLLALHRNCTTQAMEACAAHGARSPHRGPRCSAERAGECQR